MSMNMRGGFGVTEKEMFGRKFFFKRDDKFSFPKLSKVTGNKVRKLHSLYYEDNLSPFVISYGGVQSNAMRALAAVCRFKGSQLLYLSRPVPSQLTVNPIGNYLDALNDNMKLIALSNEEYRSLVQHPVLSASNLSLTILSAIFDQTGIDLSIPSNNSVIVPQGAAHALAEPGISSLASEMYAFIQYHRETTGDHTTPWKIIFATGTGISAFYAARFFHSLNRNDAIEIIAVPCATSSVRLRQDLFHLQQRLYPSQPTSLTGLPTVLSTEKFPSKRVFGGLYPEHLKIWQALSGSSETHHTDDMTFDLLYAPRTWELLLSVCGVPDGSSDYNLEQLYPDHHLLYYHCGGCEGNESQLQRYRRQGLLQ